MKVSDRRPFLFYFLNIVIPLLIGLFIYLTLRRDAFISVVLNRYVSLPELSYPKLPEWPGLFLRYYASDMLWAYALCFAVQFILGYSRRNQRISFLLCAGLVVLIELLQKYAVIHGTFDLFDIVAETCSVCISLLTVRLYEEARNEKNS